MKRTQLNVAVVGATGAVGKEMLRCLAERKFPYANLRLFASSRSVGRELDCGGRQYPCEQLKPGCFEGVDFAFFDASDAISKEWVTEARRAGACVIDNSATYRLHPEVPLVVPEVNGGTLEAVRAAGDYRGALFAGPNCTTVQLVVALKPLADRYGLKRVIVSTYQSVSGAGAAAVEELRAQTGDVLAGREAKAVKLAHPIAFNCIPQIGGFLAAKEGDEDEGATSEEKKVIVESRKILGLPNLAVACTAIRVPTQSGHAESVLCEFSSRPEPREARELLARAPGVEVVDFPMNVVAAGRDPVYVGRIRKDPSHDHGLQFWVVSDNLRKGAALNAIQIAERILA